MQVVVDPIIVARKTLHSEDAADDTEDRKPAAKTVIETAAAAAAAIAATDSFDTTDHLSDLNADLLCRVEEGGDPAEQIGVEVR